MTLPRGWLLASLLYFVGSAGSWAQTPISGVLDLSAGYAHACLITPLGLTRCWGKNGSDGLLGIGTDDPTSLAEPQRNYPAGTVRQASVGSDHACVVRTDGTVACWGRNTSGQLGGATGDPNSFSALAVPGLSNVQSIAAGGDHTCALIDDGTVKCWGAGGFGQLGNGEVDSPTPLTVTGVSNAVQIAAGSRFNCARLATGAVHCWGDNLSGQLGRDPATTPGLHSATAAAVANLGGSASDLALGSFHACAIVAGIARCWGENGSHQLGNDDATAADSFAPVNVIDSTGGTPAPLAAVRLGMGDAHGCAIRSNGALVCWGEGSSGELGNGGNSGADSPVAVTGFDGSTLAAVTVDGGHGYTCARTQLGEARCWGANASDQLGDGTASPSNTPVAVRAPQESMTLSASASAIAAGASLTLTATVNLDEFGRLDLAGATLTFYDGATEIDGCSALTLSGDPATANCTSSTLTAGLHELSALYSGGAFSSPTLAGPIQVRVTAATPTLRVQSFDFTTTPASFGAPLASIFEDTIPNAFLLGAPTPITTHLLIADDMPVAFDQLTFTAASDNSALFNDGSFSYYSGEFLGQKYKAVALRPRVDANGSANITYSVFGPGDQLLATATQSVSVIAVNDPPAAILWLANPITSAIELITTLPDHAAAGDVHSFRTDFQLQSLQGDEAAQTLTPTLTRIASSAADPLAAAPQLTGTDRSAMPTFKASYSAQASGQTGWVRYDARLSDNGDGACFESGEGTALLTFVYAVLDDLFSFTVSPPTYSEFASALAKPPAVWIPVQDFVHLAPLPNRCSRTSRVYIAKGEWAYLEASSLTNTQVARQLDEIRGLVQRGSPKTAGGERVVYGFANRGNVPISGARLSIPMPTGVASMTWQCTLNDQPCATPSGTGGVDLTFDLVVGDVVALAITVDYDGSTSFVNLRGSASYPPGIQAIQDDSQAMDLILSTNGDGRFRNGFER